MQSISVSGVQLDAGDSYFLDASATGNGSLTWNLNTVGANGTIQQNGNNASNFTLGAFDVLGTPSDISAVPELSTWTMMLIGFGLVGFRSVSYTHLDVYKRQHRRCSGG